MWRIPGVNLDLESLGIGDLTNFDLRFGTVPVMAAREIGGKHGIRKNMLLSLSPAVHPQNCLRNWWVSALLRRYLLMPILSAYARLDTRCHQGDDEGRPHVGLKWFRLI